MSDLLDREFENDGENYHFSSYVLFPSRAQVVASSLGYANICNFNESKIFYYKEVEKVGYWVGLTAPSSLNNKNVCMYFLNGNEDIILSLADLDESELADAKKIAEAFTCRVYNYTLKNLSDFLTDDENYCWRLIDDPDYSLLSYNKIIDPWKLVYDKGTLPVFKFKKTSLAEGLSGNTIFYAIRERTEDGVVKYDLFMDICYE